MQLIEAALAFAITMLVLSLVVSSFVELVHRIFSMREEGLKHMLGRLFDQVLAKYVVKAELGQIADSKLTQGQKNLAQAAIDKTRKRFVERMSANRAPMGAKPKATPSDAPEKVEHNKNWAISLWSGRDLADMTPAEFMERLGSIDVGKDIAAANKAANDAFNDAANTAADMADTVLKDVAQKFEAFGKEASVYFEGRARLLSVIVAIALAFAAHVDAVDLFRTYLRDPNARAKVIEQAEAVTAQHKAAAEAATALTKLAEVSPETADEVKKQVDALKEDWRAAITNAKGAVKQYADLGVPLGWTDERIGAAIMYPLVWTCINPQTKESEGFAKLRQDCPKDEAGYTGLKDRQYMEVWVQVPTRLSTWFFLFLGGLLIGLGSPFWYSAVTGLTELRSGARGTTPAAAPSATAAAVTGEGGKAQPVTPVGAFQVSKLAQG
jgi:uncharacterized membrane protein required for colicin V production